MNEKRAKEKKTISLDNQKLLQKGLINKFSA